MFDSLTRRSLRLIPLASVLLAACTVNKPQGPGQSPTSPQWQQHQQAVQQITRYQTRGAFARFPTSRKFTRALTGSRPRPTAIACC